MLGFCGEHGIGAGAEVIDADQMDQAYDRVVAGDVRFRFVIDISTLAQAGIETASFSWCCRQGPGGG